MDHYQGRKRTRTEEHGSPPVYRVGAYGHKHGPPSHPDYTVIIKWKDWCAFESEDDEKGVDLLQRKRKKWDMAQVHTHFEPEGKSEEPEKNPTSIVIDDVDKGGGLMPMDVECVCVDENVGTQQGKQSQQEELGGNTSCLQESKVQEGFDMKMEEQEKTQSVTRKVQPQHEGSRAPIPQASCDHEGCRKAPFRAPISGEAEALETRMYNTPQNLRDGASTSARLVKEEAVDMLFKAQEAVDMLVVREGKVKICDVKTIYEKSYSTSGHSAHAGIYKPLTEASSPDKHATSHGPVVEANLVRQGEYLVNYERRTKRNREILHRSEVNRGAFVRCPICNLIIHGDIQNADFNNQFNMHVDSCIGSS